MAEYDLSASSATAVDYTQSGTSWTAQAMAFYIAASGPSVAQTSPNWYGEPEANGPGRQALGFYYDDDTALTLTWSKGVNTGAVPPSLLWELDCDTTSRNFDVNTAYMREPEGELPVLAWPGPGVIGTVVPPPKLPELDCDTVSRNFDVDSTVDQISQLEQPNPALLIFNAPAMPFEWDGADQSHNLDQFLAKMQVLDDLDKTPQNFAPVMDWTADYDWQQSRTEGVAQGSPYNPAVLEDYYHPAPFFPLFGWDEVDWQRSTDTRVVEDEDERELAWPIPVFNPFNAKIDWTSDYDWQQSRDTRVVVDEDEREIGVVASLYPRADWTADYDWQQTRDTRVVEDEDERELAWPIPAGAQLLKLGWDQDGEVSRWFGTWTVEDEDAPAARPFVPILTWDDLDTLQAIHFNPPAFNFAEFVEDDRSLQKIAAQIIALALQQMVALPLLGMQLMTAIPLMLCQAMQAAPASDELDVREMESVPSLGIQGFENVLLLGIQEMENEY